MESGIKKAAIKLKGIGKADRRWLLNQLSREEKARLLPVLSELDQISFAQIADLDEVLDDRLPDTTQNNAPVFQAMLQHCPGEQLAAVLDSVSDVYLSLLLRDNKEAAHHPMIKLLAPHRQQRVLALAAQRSVQFDDEERMMLEHFVTTQLEASHDGRNL